MEHERGSAHPYPQSDTPLILPSGTTVRVRNLIVFHGTHRRHLTIMIETPTPATARERNAREACELANMFREYAETKRLDGIRVAICRTQACLETRESASEMFQFIRDEDGAWTETSLPSCDQELCNRPVNPTIE